MIKFKADDAGFSVTELIMIIIIVALVGTVGWIVNIKHQQDQQTSTSKALPTKSLPLISAKPVNHPSIKPLPAQAYIDIKELGIKFPIPQSISDLTYTWGAVAPNSGSVATLLSQSWLNYVKTNDPSCLSGNSTSSTPPSDWVGYINLVTVPTPNSFNTVTVNGKTYAFEGPQSGCNPNDPGNPGAVNQKQVANSQAIEASFKQAVAD